MNVWQSVKASLSLLSRRDQGLMIAVTTIQLLISGLDLVGILLLGVVAALAASAATGVPVGSGGLESFLSQLPNSFGFIAAIALIAAMFLILKSMLGLLLTRRTFRFLANRQALVAGAIAERLLTRPLLEVQSRSSQSVSIALTSGVSALVLTILGQSVIIASESSLVAVLFLALLLVDPLVAVFSVLFFGMLVALLHFLLGSWATTLGRKSTAANIDSIAAVQQAMKAYREISVAGRRRLFIDRFRALRLDAAQVTSDIYILNQIGKYVFEIGLVVGAGLLAVIVAATKDITSGIAIITVFLVASARIFPSLLRMQAALSNIRRADGEASVTLELVSDLDKTEVLGCSTHIPQSTGQQLKSFIQEGFDGFDPCVSVKNVSLKFPGSRQLALESVSLEIRPNQSVAIVGSTGAGKTTLADAILGLLLTDEGSVTISGVSPAEAVRRWPGAMAYVPQEVSVLAGTVRENVALGIPHDIIDDSMVWDALKRAHLADFLASSRDGIETLVGENGVQLSGGQRQRLGIARALYSCPKLIVLDEATSALDAETEKLMNETLANLAGDVTLLIIAHRLATIRDCDQVVYLSMGRIVGQGSFNAVRKQVPDFDKQAKLLGL
jgi:ABC-type multidrug transport system fused ATPase/permease subunit